MRKFLPYLCLYSKLFGLTGGGFCFLMLLSSPASAQLLTGYGAPQEPMQAQVEALPRYVEPESSFVPSLIAPESLTVSPQRLTSPQSLIAPQVEPQKPLRRRAEAPRLLTGADPVAVYMPLVASPLSHETSGVQSSEREGAVDLQADDLFHDKAMNVILASGDVMLVQDGRILRADKISYNLDEDTVVATGHVVLNEENGDIHYSEYVEFNDKLKSGFIKGLKTYLSDGSRFTAKEGVRESGTKTIMEEASYTPCECADDDPDARPLWQIKASKVFHDQEEHRISYNNARFEVLGVPVAYTPYFSHPDGSVKRKSGFLSPSVGYRSELGGFIENTYYWNVAPNRDVTIGLLAFSKQTPLVFGEYRQRWADAALELDAGVTYSERIDNRDGIRFARDEELRGHVLAKGLWNIDDKWRAGADISWASDDQYMRQYDFVDEDVLESEIYVERFSGRNYAVGRLVSFQDLRVREDQEEEPEVLPEIVTSFIGEPGAVPLVAGRWSLDASLLSLRRSAENQDVGRLSVDAGWKRRFVSDYGFLTTVDASLRGDFYNTRDKAAALPGSGLSGTTYETRVFPSVHLQSSYPVAKVLESAQLTIEPIVALTLAGNANVSNDIPNEDSQDVQLDASNIFEPSRFPGLDRVEDESRVTYGVRTGLYGYQGSYADAFLGQSYRFDDTSPFPVGSGLEEQQSDIVGQVSAAYRGRYHIDYRFQLDADSFASRRHEVDASADWGRFSLGSRYLYASELEGTDIDDTREQVQASAAYYLAREWRLRTGATQDLGDNPGLRQASLALDYFGQCVSWSLIGERNLTDDASGDSDTEILFRIGLKNLGEFRTSGLRESDTKE